MKVRKKNGSEEEFIREKIVVAIVKAGGSLENARAIAKEVENTFAARGAVTTGNKEGSLKQAKRQRYKSLSKLAQL